MTIARALLGDAYDSPAVMPADIGYYDAKQHMVQVAIERAKKSGEADLLYVAWWEMALLRFSPFPRENTTPYQGATYEAFAASFGLTSATVEYAVERVSETLDVVLRLHYLGFALDRLPQTGRPWIDRQREMIKLWRQYVDATRAAAPADTEGFCGLFIERALTGCDPILARPGVLRAAESRKWAIWLLQLALDAREFPASKPERDQFWRHRWVSPFLRHLTSLQASAADGAIRAQAFALLADAAGYYATEALSDTFAHLVAEVRYELRVHWGDADAHKDKVRDQVAALLRRANLHKCTGNGMLTQHFFRAARRLAEEHRQYFSQADVDEMMKEERAAIVHAVEAGEFKTVSAAVDIPAGQITRVRDTPAETVAGLVAEVASHVPTRASLEAIVVAATAEAPLHRLFGTTVVGDGKVVGESHGEEKNFELDLENCALLQAKISGAAMSSTIIAAAGQIGLTAVDLMDPLSSLPVDAGTFALILHGCERLTGADFVSACHILVPRVEDVLRQYLRSRGLHATEFKRDVGDGTSRTDDEPLGSMLARTLPGGVSVRDHLSPEFVDHIQRTMTSQTGLNLRNTFAHGQARPQHCTPENAGIVLTILYKVAKLAA